jgi:hypothetical protein
MAESPGRKLARSLRRLAQENRQLLRRRALFAKEPQDIPVAERHGLDGPPEALHVFKPKDDPARCGTPGLNLRWVSPVETDLAALGIPTTSPPLSLPVDHSILHDFANPGNQGLAILLPQLGQSFEKGHANGLKKVLPLSFEPPGTEIAANRPDKKRIVELDQKTSSGTVSL